MSESEIEAIKESRDELDVTLKDVGEAMATLPAYDVAGSTLAGRLSEWERGAAEPSDADLMAVEAALDSIEEEKNFEHPACENPECGRVPEKEPMDVSGLDVEGELWCLICHYRSFGP